MEAEDLTFDDLRARARSLQRHASPRRRRHHRRQLHLHAHDRRPDQDADHERAFERQVDYVGGAGVVAKHLRAAGADVTFSTVLGDDELRDFVLEGPGKAGVELQGRSSTRPGRPPTRTRSSPAAIAC